MTQTFLPLINRVFGAKNITEEKSLIKEIDSLQSSFGKYSFRKNQHLGFEAAA
jgi:hypothetical protein